MRPMILFLFLISFLSVHTHAQDRLSTPQLGTVLAPDGTLNDIRGVPGAARLVRTSGDARFAALYQASHSRLLVAATDTTLLVIPAPSSTITLSLRPTAVAVSPSGMYLAYILDGSLLVCPISALTSTAACAGHHAPISLVDVGLSSTPTALAVGDSGTVIVSDHTSTSVVRSTGFPSRLPFPLALPRFVPHSPRAVAHAASDQAVLALDTATLTTEALVTVADDLTVPSGIEIAGSIVWIAQTGATNLLAYSLDAHTVAKHTLPTSGSLRSLGVPGIYLWSDFTLLDTRNTSPQLLLLPTEAR